MRKRNREKSDVHAQTTADPDSENHALREENRVLREENEALKQETAMLLVRGIESSNAKALDINREMKELIDEIDDEIKECRSVLRRPKSPLVSVGAFGRMRATPKSVDKMQKNSLERK